MSYWLVVGGRWSVQLVVGRLAGGRWSVIGWQVDRRSVVGGRLVGGFKKTVNSR